MAVFGKRGFVGAAAYDANARLEEVVFAMSVGAVSHAEVVFAETELGAATYGVDVELEQEVMFD